MRLEKAGRCSRHKHRGALRGTPGSACPQPEPNATELPSCAPISARAAQRRRWRRRWRGEEDAHRPGPEGHKSCATSCGTSSAKSFATSCTTRPSRAHLSLIAQGKRGGRHACVGRGSRHWKMTCATMNTSTPPSSTAPNTSTLPPSTAPNMSSATSSVTSCATSCAASLACSSFTCHRRESVGAARVCWAWVPPLEDDDGEDKHLHALFGEL